MKWCAGVPLLLSLTLPGVVPLVAGACHTRTRNEPPAGVVPFPSGASDAEASATGATVAPGATSGIPAAPTASESLPVAPLPADALAKSDCLEMLDKSDELFKKALSTVSDHCQTSTDCAFSKGTCRPGCGGLVLPRKATARYEQAAAEAMATCERFDKGHCVASIPLPIPSCARFRPECVEGRCKAVPAQ